MVLKERLRAFGGEGFQAFRIGLQELQGGLDLPLGRLVFEISGWNDFGTEKGGNSMFHDFYA